MIAQRAVLVVVAALVGVAVGAVVMKSVGESQLNAEAQAIARRFGLKPTAGGAVDVASLVDGLAPGTSDAIKGAIATTALAGVGSAVLVALVLREVGS